jgi:hypothetical protein
MRGEKLMSLPEASKWIEQELGLKRSRVALWQWVTRGHFGVKLEAVSVGGKWYTSQGAVRRFLSDATRAHAAEYGSKVEELTV